MLILRSSAGNCCTVRRSEIAPPAASRSVFSRRDLILEDVRLDQIPVPATLRPIHLPQRMNYPNRVYEIEYPTIALRFSKGRSTPLHIIVNCCDRAQISSDAIEIASFVLRYNTIMKLCTNVRTILRKLVRVTFKFERIANRTVQRIRTCHTIRRT